MRRERLQDLRRSRGRLGLCGLYESFSMGAVGFSEAGS